MTLKEFWWRLRFVLTLGWRKIPGTPAYYKKLKEEITKERDDYDTALVAVRTVKRKLETDIASSEKAAIDPATDAVAKRDHLAKILRWREQFAMQRTAEAALEVKSHAATMDLAQFDLDEHCEPRHHRPEMADKSARLRARRESDVAAADAAKVDRETLASIIGVSDQDDVLQELEDELRDAAKEREREAKRVADKAAADAAAAAKRDEEPPATGERPFLRSIQGDLARAALGRTGEKGEPIGQGYEEVDDDDDEGDEGEPPAPPQAALA